MTVEGRNFFRKQFCRTIHKRSVRFVISCQLQAQRHFLRHIDNNFATQCRWELIQRFHHQNRQVRVLGRIRDLSQVNVSNTCNSAFVFQTKAQRCFNFVTFNQQALSRIHRILHHFVTQYFKFNTQSICLRNNRKSTHRFIPSNKVDRCQICRSITTRICVNNANAINRICIGHDTIDRICAICRFVVIQEVCFQSLAPALNNRFHVGLTNFIWMFRKFKFFLVNPWQ